MYRLNLYLILTCLLLGSCNDHLEIEANNLPQGYADSQVVGSWKITAVMSDAPFDWDGNGSVETNVYNAWASCEKDNLYTFVGNKTGTYRLNCNLTKTGTWQIFNVKDLQYTPDGMNTVTERIISMTSVQFKTTRLYFVPPASNVTLTTTWSRQ